jgi:hypothetical protein
MIGWYFPTLVAVAAVLSFGGCSSKGTIACLTLGTLEERLQQLALKHAGG